MLDTATRQRLDVRALDAQKTIATLADPVVRTTLEQQAFAVRDYLYAAGAEPNAASALVLVLETRVAAVTSSSAPGFWDIAVMPPKTPPRTPAGNRCGGTTGKRCAQPSGPTPAAAPPVVYEAPTTLQGKAVDWWDTLPEGQRQAIAVGAVLAIGLGVYAYTTRKKKR